MTSPHEHSNRCPLCKGNLVDVVIENKNFQECSKCESRFKTDFLYTQISNVIADGNFLKGNHKQ